MAMSVAELGALGEFVGSILVLGTLIYLAVQVRQAKSSILSANAVNITQVFNPINLALAENAELFDLFYRGCNEPGSLTEQEEARLHFLLRAFNNNFYSLHQCSQKGTVPEETWESLSRNYAELLSTPCGSNLIESLRFASPEWSSVMEELARSTGGPMKWTAEGFQRA